MIFFCRQQSLVLPISGICPAYADGFVRVCVLINLQRYNLLVKKPNFPPLFRRTRENNDYWLFNIFTKNHIPKPWFFISLFILFSKKSAYP